MASHHIAALMTSHNRRVKTLACLGALRRQQLPSHVILHVFLVDAGSTDGTPEAVAKRFPDVRLMETDANVFWNRGMSMAFAAALEEGFQSYLWLNDDTLLDDDALMKFLKTSHSDVVSTTGPSIVVGCTRDPETGETTYGGVVRSSRVHPLKFQLAATSSIPQSVDTMNGNCVLIPDAVARLVGNLDSSYTHSIGDFDYGLRARRAGCSIWLVPDTVGTCARSDTVGTWQDISLSLQDRWRKLRGPKGLPPAEWLTFARRHAGIGWPIYWSLPYIKFFTSTFRIGHNR